MKTRLKQLSSWLLGIAAALLLLALSWVASNGRWADALPRPVSAELALRPVTVAPERNAFFDMQGLEAPDGVDINAVGRAELTGEREGGTWQRRWPQGELWQCKAGERDCVRLWLAHADELRRDLVPLAVVGERCEALARAEFFEERWTERPAQGPLSQVSVAALPFPRFAGLTSCMRWFGMRATLEPDVSRAMAELTRADRLGRRMLEGAHSLIGTMIGISLVQNNWLVAGDLLAARHADPALMEPLLAPLPASALNPRAWIPHEAWFGRAMLREMTDAVRPCAEGGEAGVEQGWLGRQWCRLGLGLLPEQSQQDSDAAWLRRLASVPAQGPVACEVLLSESWMQANHPSLAWRNTIARWTLESASGHWQAYVARQSDLELLRLTLLASLRHGSLPQGVTIEPGTDGLRLSACRARVEPRAPRALIRLPALAEAAAR